MTPRLESAEERRARISADAEVVLERSLAAQELPRTVEDLTVLRKVAVLVESPVRSQQVGR